MSSFFGRVGRGEGVRAAREIVVKAVRTSTTSDLVGILLGIVARSSPGSPAEHPHEVVQPSERPGEDLLLFIGGPHVSYSLRYPLPYAPW
jgi:hypothetical protein